MLNFNPAALEKVKKLLALADSPNDYEAIASYRTARALMQKNNIEWSDLSPQDIFSQGDYFARKTTTPKPPPETPKEPWPPKPPPQEPWPPREAPKPPPKPSGRKPTMAPQQAYEKLLALLNDEQAYINPEDKEVMGSMVNTYGKFGSYTDPQLRYIYVLLKRNDGL